MNKILPLVLGMALFTGCGFGDDFFDDSYGYEDEYYDEDWGMDTQQFARSDRFQDESTVWNNADGVALANDDEGAVGMVGMICSVDTQSGNIQTDVDESDGDEIVVDAMQNGDSVQIGAIDGAQITIAEFQGWDGWVETDVTVPGGDVSFLALTHEGRIILQQVDDTGCRVTRAAAGEVSSVELPGACLGLDANVVTGLAYVSTTSGTVAVELDNSYQLIGPAADVVAWSGITNDVALGNAGGNLIQVYRGTDLAFSLVVDGLVSASYVAEGNLAVATVNSLSLYSPEGTLLDTADTEADVRSMTSSPDGNMLAVESDETGLIHMVRITN